MVETKAHHGMVTYDGRQLLLNGHPFEKDFIAQINRNIHWLREKLRLATGMNVWIVAVLVFPNALVYSEEGKRVLRLKPVKRVNVINGKCLTSLLKMWKPKHTHHNTIWTRLSLLKL